MDMKQYQQDWFKNKNQNAEWKLKRNLARAQKRRNNKEKAVLHMGNKCQHCGISYPNCCYDFHHKDPTDMNDIPSSVLNRSWKKIVLELEKCIMLCSNCHRIEHNKDGYVAHEKRKKRYL